MPSSIKESHKLSSSSPGHYKTLSQEEDDDNQSHQNGSNQRTPPNEPVMINRKPSSPMLTEEGVLEDDDRSNDDSSKVEVDINLVGKSSIDETDNQLEDVNENEQTEIEMNEHNDDGNNNGRDIVRSSYEGPRFLVHMVELLIRDRSRFRTELTYTIKPWKTKEKWIEIFKWLWAWKFSIAFSFAPYFTYLFFFSNHQTIFELFGVKNRIPYIDVLPAIDYFFFRCLPHRVLGSMANPVFDLIAAMPYLFHFILPFAFLGYLGINKRGKDLLRFVWVQGTLNMVGLIIQLSFPTSPPWFTDSTYFDYQKNNFVSDAPVEAGFQRVDAMFGMSLFHNIYSGSPLLFGAFPSLHVGWPTTIWAVTHKPWIGRKFAFFHICWVATAAVYINHHYVIDAVGGFVLGTLIGLFAVYVWCPVPSEKYVSTKLYKKIMSRRNQRSEIILTENGE